MEKPDQAATNSPAPPAAPPRRSLPLWPKLLALAISFLFALGLSEIAVRFFFADEVNTRLLHERDWLFRMGGLVEPSGDPELLYELRRDLSVEWKGVIVATDAVEPVRISSSLPSSADSSVRIALIGDSGAFGWGVEYESTYGEILRRNLEEILGAGVDLRNYAVPGYNTLQERILFERDVLAWKPHLVILHYDHNDPEPKAGAPRDNITAEYGDNPIHSALWKFALRRLRVARIKKSFQFEGGDQAGESNRHREWLYRGPLWEDHAKELMRIGELAAENDVPAIAFIWCHSVERKGSGWDEEHFELVHQPLLTRLDEAGFQVLDTYPRFQALMQAEGWKNLDAFRISPYDPHPNRACLEILAQYLSDFITSRPAILRRLEEVAKGVVTERQPASFSTAGDRFREASRLVRLGKSKEAEAIFRQLANENPENATFRVRLLETLLALGNPAEAEQELNRISAIKPDYVMPYVRIAEYYRARLDYERAIALLKQAVKSASIQYLEVHARELLADTLFDAGRIGEAEEEYYRIREITGNHHFFAPLVTLAEKLLLKGNAAEAAAHLQAVLDDDASNPRAREMLARCFEMERRAGEAIALLDSLIEEQPENQDFLRRAAWLRATSPAESDHDAPRAVAQARKAVAEGMNPDPRAWTALAAALADNGEFQAAVEAADQAIAHYEQVGNSAAAAEIKRFREGFERGQKIRVAPPQPR